MSHFPTATLNEVCDFQNGGTPSKAVERYFTGNIPWITGADLVGPIAQNARSFITEEAITSSATNKVPAGTVLLVTRTSVGKVAIAGTELCFSQDITALLPDSAKLDAGYLVHFLRTKEDHFSRYARGATIKGITRQVVADLVIPLPPLEEQRRIAAILDQAETLRTQRRTALALLDSLTQSLFLDMFGDMRTEPDRWPKVPFEAIVKDSRIGLVRGSQELDDSHPYPYLRMNAITRDGELKLEGALRATATTEELETYCLRDGDFLFNTRNSRELVGKTALFRGNELYLFNNNLLRVRFVETAHPEYVVAAFKTQYVQNELELRKSGTTNVFAVYYKDLRTLPIPLPPLPLQQTFATRIASIEALKATHRRALAALDALFASLQQRAFAGAL